MLERGIFWEGRVNSGRVAYRYLKGVVFYGRGG